MPCGSDLDHFPKQQDVLTVFHHESGSNLTITNNIVGARKIEKLRWRIPYVLLITYVDFSVSNKF